MSAQTNRTRNVRPHQVLADQETLKKWGEEIREAIGKVIATAALHHLSPKCNAVVVGLSLTLVVCLQVLNAEDSLDVIHILEGVSVAGAALSIGAKD